MSVREQALQLLAGEVKSWVKRAKCRQPQSSLCRLGAEIKSLDPG